MNILTVTITEAGRELAGRLPFEHVHGRLATTVRSRWQSVDAFVLFASAGIAVRTIAPLLGDKAVDPAVVCVDEGGRWAVALVGGHAGGANRLAAEVSALLGATAVVTTATDASGLPALDVLRGFNHKGDLAGVTRALLDGETVMIERRCSWPLPVALTESFTSAPGSSALPRVVVDHRLHPDLPGVCVLHPPALVIGLGASTGSPPEEVADLVAAALADGGLAPSSVGMIATLDRKRDDPAIGAIAASFDVPLVDFTAEQLAPIAVPSPSEVVRAAVGTPSVCEAACLAAAGPRAELLVPKRRSASATVAVALRMGPRGHLSVVGLGPGDARHRTPAATAAVRRADVVIGYGPYVELVRDAIDVATEVICSPIGDEVGRSSTALDRAARGARVALVCSGDAGVYALATLVLELAPEHPGLDPVTDIEIVPGVTAAITAAAVLGAPLGHDHASISLSDLLTPWEVIEGRLDAAARADMVVSLYNPRSAGRDWQLAAACRILSAHRPRDTPVGVVTDAGRPAQRVALTTLSGFDPSIVTMTSCVVIGASSTRVIAGRMVTPRGYKP